MSDQQREQAGRAPASPGQSRRPSTGISVVPLSGPLGAEVRGIRLSGEVSDADLGSILSAFRQCSALLFRDQDISDQEHVAFSRRLGELAVHNVRQYVLAEMPEILGITNVPRAGKVPGNAKGARYWHSDLSYEDRPSLASLLHAIEVPPEGGDTLYANMYMAYEALPEDVKRRLEGLKAVHRWDKVKSEERKASLSPEEKDRFRDSIHPVVRTHPETGKKCLYVNEGFTTRILGLSDKESVELLDSLFQHSTEPKFVYRHRWRRDDVFMWDNRCLIHRATEFDPQCHRRMHRVTVRGEVPF